MSGHSPQRPRKALHPTTPGSLHNMPGRENSPSPFRDRQRTIKAQSMPLVPTAAQIFAANQQPYPGLQASPTSSTSSRRSPPMQPPQVQRLLPTPPHPNPPNLQDRSPSPGASASAQLQANITHYPRPINRVPPPQFLSNLHDLEQNWQMTDELMAEIERADLQQAQGMANAHIYSSYPVGSGYNTGNATADSSVVRDLGVERVRVTGKSSPKVPEGQLGRRPSVRESRESPKARDRPSFSPNQSQTPERRKSPPYHSPLGSPGEHYGQYVHDPAPVVRNARPAATATTATTTTHDSRPNLSLATQTPPLQAITARTPDKSLPLQEEPEEEVPVAATSKAETNSREPSRYMHQIHHQREPEHGSPTPSSDLNPEGSYAQDGRNSRAALRPEDEETLFEKSDKQDSSNDGSGTPRSPSAGLPVDPNAQNRFRPPPQSQPRGPVPVPPRGRGRNGSTDQLGLRGLDTSLFEQVEQVRSVEQPPQYAEAPRPGYKVDPRIQESYAHYYQQLHPDDLQSVMDDPTSAYIQAYLRSPRPDAPIPPTPHSQTSPPSPSPMLSGRYDNSKESYAPFSPVAPAGSPYPYPFTHVRRNMSYSGHSQSHSNLGLNPAVIQEQFVKQFQMYAQNHSGNITDSTLSPSSTPYPPTYNPWAYWHTQRLMGGQIPDTVTTRSSPSHEPVPLPPPPMASLRRKSDSANLRAYRPAPTKPGRKPPPRVDSTQPRETSPEPSTSGEETAGEETTHFAVSEEGNWVNGSATVIPIPIVDDSSLDEWIDEDEEEDEEDLLELEYHPTYVTNVEKRRRRWETRWDALLQAFQALDRQTDATMVLLAAPSHSAKLHLVTSRSIRRQPVIGHSQALKTVRSGFRQVAAQRRSSRSQKSSLVDRFLNASSGSGEGSDGSSESNKEDMKRVLDAALGSLNVMRKMYEQREARWIDEMRRVSEDRERVELLLKQVLGEEYALKSAITDARP